MYFTSLLLSQGIGRYKNDRVVILACYIFFIPTKDMHVSSKWFEYTCSWVTIELIIFIWISTDYGIPVALPVPQYFECTMVQTHHHPLAYRQIHTSVSYYCYFPQWPLCSGTRNQLISSLTQILTLSNQESARSTIHSLKLYTVFILLLNSS